MIIICFLFLQFSFVVNIFKLLSYVMNLSQANAQSAYAAYL